MASPSGRWRTTSPSCSTIQTLTRRAVLGFGVQQSGILRTTNPLGEVAQGVADHDQRPTRSQPSACPIQHVVLEMQVGQQHEVESHTSRRLPRPHVCDDPVDIDAHLLRPTTTTFDSLGGEVDGSDLPSQRCQPDRMSALPRAQIECLPGEPRADGCSDPGVRCRGPHPVRTGIPAVPLLSTVPRRHLTEHLRATVSSRLGAENGAGAVFGRVGGWGVVMPAAPERRCTPHDGFAGMRQTPAGSVCRSPRRGRRRRHAPGRPGRRRRRRWPVG